MSMARLHLRFWLVLGLLVPAFVGEGWWCVRTRGQCMIARKHLAAKQRELAVLRRQMTGVASGALVEIAAELAQAEETRGTLRSALGAEGQGDDGNIAWKLPATRTEAFLELNEFVGEFRDRARVQGVTIRPGECFGFASYTRTGPESELYSAVHRQRVVIQHLLAALLELRPMEIIAVQRERPRVRPEAESGAGFGDSAEDYFEMDTARSTTTPGIAESIAIRLRFTGYTPVLRDFLNALRQDDLPLLVRSVEVKPAAKPALAGAETAAIQPMFAPQVMQFTVTIEHVRLLAEEMPVS